MADGVQWHLSGDYFENCSCTVVCPCLVSKEAPLTSRPTEGVCNVPLAFHIESGSYGSVSLDGLNVALAIQTPGPMADGNWSVAAYIDERADDKQTEALGAIFTGAAGGHMAHFAPLICKAWGIYWDVTNPKAPDPASVLEYDGYPAIGPPFHGFIWSHPLGLAPQTASDNLAYLLTKRDRMGHELPDLPVEEGATP